MLFVIVENTIVVNFLSLTFYTLTYSFQSKIIVYGPRRLSRKNKLNNTGFGLGDYARGHFENDQLTS